MLVAAKPPKILSPFVRIVLEVPDIRTGSMGLLKHYLKPTSKLLQNYIKTIREEAVSMAKVKAVSSSESKRQIRPAITPEAREQQLISLAVDLVEKRLLEGTASSQETTHFLKLATQKYKYETQILEKQRDLVVAKTEVMQSQKRSEELFEKAVKAFRGYSGQGGEEDEYDEY